MLASAFWTATTLVSAALQCFSPPGDAWQIVEGNCINQVNSLVLGVGVEIINVF